MGIPSLCIQGFAFSFVFCASIAALSETNNGIHMEGSLSIQDGIKSSIRPHTLAQGTNDAASKSSEMSDSARSSALPNVMVRPLAYKSYVDFYTMWLQSTEQSRGTSRRGVTHSAMRHAFAKKLRGNILKHLGKFMGGTIEEFGDIAEKSSQKCLTRPSLTMAKVEELARKSFGVKKFHVAHPPCDNGGQTVSCQYDSEKCCKRPQVEFIGRYYDTAVAAMALGATREEAFAPLVHSRVLAYALEGCDPRSSYRGDFSANDILFDVAVQNRYRAYISRKRWLGRDTSLISFPVAYEVLYELYNTMLIERMRSRRTVQFPTDAQMQDLNNAVYYKKVVAQATYLDIDLSPDIVFPDVKDFSRAGLTMASSSRIMEMSRMASTGELHVEPISESELHPTLRYSSERISLFEKRSQLRKVVDTKKCNANMNSLLYYPFKFQERVWDQMQGCCARECRFMALYGRTFSKANVNCCSGCNRFGCKANNFHIAQYLANISTIEVPSKSNSGPEQITLTV